MATSTTRLGLSKPDGTDVVDIAVLNANADKLDIAAGAYICTSSTRPATPWNGQFIYETDTFTALVYKSSTSSWSPLGGSTVGPTPPSGASKGDLWWDSDTGRLYVYYVDANSSQWVAASNSSTNTVGLVPIVVPTVAISGGTASTNTAGTISFSGATSIQLNNAFSSSYDRYLMQINVTANTATSALTGQLVAGGVAATATNYNNVVLVSASDNTTVTASATGASSFGTLEAHVSSNTNLAMAELLFIDPFAARKTKIPFTATGSNAGGLIVRRTGFANHSLASSYDGIKFTVASGTMDGNITVYGYNS